MTYIDWNGAVRIAKPRKEPERRGPDPEGTTTVAEGWRVWSIGVMGSPAGPDDVRLFSVSGKSRAVEWKGSTAWTVCPDCGDPPGPCGCGMHAFARLEDCRRLMGRSWWCVAHVEGLASAQPYRWQVGSALGIPETVPCWRAFFVRNTHLFVPARFSAAVEPLRRRYGLPTEVLPDDADLGALADRIGLNRRGHPLPATAAEVVSALQELRAILIEALPGDHQGPEGVLPGLDTAIAGVRRGPLGRLVGFGEAVDLDAQLASIRSAVGTLRRQPYAARAAGTLLKRMGESGVTPEQAMERVGRNLPRRAT